MTARPPELVKALTAAAGPLADLGVPVATQVPGTRPARFIRVVTTGGSEIADYALAQPTALIECWAAKTTDAYELAANAWIALRATEGVEIGPGLWVQEARVTLPVDFPDTHSGSPRWQFIFNPIVAQEETP